VNTPPTVVVPDALLRGLYESDRATDGHPVLPEGKAEEARKWLRRVAVDFGALDAHIGLLQELYDSPFRYPPLRRDCWLPEQHAIDLEGTRFRHRDRLPEDRIVAVLDGGPEALRPDELPRLLLNPIALHDLFDVINDVLPERWLADVQRMGPEAFTRETPPPLVPAPVPVTAPKPAEGPASQRKGTSRNASRWLASLGALAACLLLGLFVGLVWNRGGTGSGFSVAQARADYRLVEVRDGKRELRVVIDSDRKGFAVLVVPMPGATPLVFPGIAAGPVSVTPGEAVTIPPLSGGLKDATVALVVITEQPAGDAIRRALGEQKFEPDQIAKLQEFLAKNLAESNYHWAAFSSVKLGPPKNP
jgi:hypothetical protein